MPDRPLASPWRRAQPTRHATIGPAPELPSEVSAIDNHAGPSPRDGSDKPPHAIELGSVGVFFGEVAALRDLSFTVGAGEVVCLLGPNGAGKTTALNVCCGLVEPDEGTARILGRTVTLRDRDLRSSIGVLPQNSALYPELTGTENLELFGAMYAIEKPKRRIDEVLELLDLSARKKSRVSTYSGGMQRRLALGRALLHDPPVLLLDEPTLGVDPHGRRSLWDHIATLSNMGRAILITTNYLDEATALADRVVIIDRGEVVAEGSPDQLRREGGITLELRCAATPSRVAAELENDPEVTSIAVTGDVVVVGLKGDDSGPRVLEKARAVEEIVSFRTEEPTLEEVFLRLTGHQPTERA